VLNVIRDDDDDNNHNQINELVGSREEPPGFQMRYPYIPNQEFDPQEEPIVDIEYYQQYGNAHQPQNVFNNDYPTNYLCENYPLYPNDPYNPNYDQFELPYYTNGYQTYYY
jgi:hypothetical protein